MATDTLGILKDYLAALEAGETTALARFFHPDVVQEEFPNRLVPGGARRTLVDLLESAQRGQQVLKRQSFALQNALVVGNNAALEVQWAGQLAVPLGSLQPGDEMRARFAVFVELREGKIFRQRNYDCFDAY